MDLEEKRFLVAGATGVLGSLIARRLESAGARVAPAGRDPDRLSELGGDLSGAPIELEITDPESRRTAIGSAIESLGGLDGVVVATGAVAFGRSGEISGDAEARMMAVNAEGPIGLIAEALPKLEEGGAVIGMSAVVADFPTAGMAAYSASKAALSAYLTALRRERRKELACVLDVKPGHMETGFADRALAGEPPKMPTPQDEEDLVGRIIEALRSEARELSYDPREQELSQR